MQTVEEVLEDFKERGFLRGNKLEALRSAMFAYRLDVIKVLMDMGVDIHTNNDEVLRYASEYGLYEIVVYLLEKGANVHVFDEYPIRYAAENGHTDIVKLLHENGAKFKTANCSIFKHIVKCTYPKSIEMMQYVISKSKMFKTKVIK